MSTPLLWFANRGTGMVLLLLLTAGVVLGMLSTARMSSRWWPRFLTQGLHRNVALLSLLLLGMHVTTAVVDSYVDIGWADAAMPFRGAYRPGWLGLGTLAVDALAAVVVTSLLRRRLGHRRWRGVHLLAYAAWALAAAHGLGIGTDVRTPFMAALTAACCGAVVTAAVLRLSIGRARLEAVR